MHLKEESKNDSPCDVHRLSMSIFGFVSNRMIFPNHLRQQHQVLNLVLDTSPLEADRMQRMSFVTVNSTIGMKIYTFF